MEKGSTQGVRITMCGLQIVKLKSRFVRWSKSETNSDFAIIL